MIKKSPKREVKIFTNSIIYGGVVNVMLFFHSIGVATPMLWKNNILKTLHL
jgi:hypothetical protein